MEEFFRQSLEKLDKLSAASGRLSFDTAVKDLAEWWRDVRQRLELQGEPDPAENLRRAGDPKTVALNDFETLVELTDRYRRILSMCIGALSTGQGAVAAGVPSVRPPDSNETTYALVMKGGGVKGLGLAAAAEVLERHYKFTTFSGTSAGAIAAGLMAAGYSAQELCQILQKKDFREFLDPVYRRYWNLFVERWLNSGYPVQEWVGRLLDERIPREGDVLLSNLSNRVVIFAANERDGTVTFDSANLGDAKESLDVAIRCSMAIPFFFAPVQHRGQETFDGGIGNNFPLKEFLTLYKGPFVGLYLTSGQQKTYRQPKSRIAKLLNLAIGRDERVTVDQYKEFIVPIDPTPIKTTQFSLSSIEKDLLLAAGRAAALRFLMRTKPGTVTQAESDEAGREEKRLRTIVVHRHTVQKWWKVAAAIGIVSALVVWFYATPPPPPPPPALSCVDSEEAMQALDKKVAAQGPGTRSFDVDEDGVNDYLTVIPIHGDPKHIYDGVLRVEFRDACAPSRPIRRVEWPTGGVFTDLGYGDNRGWIRENGNLMYCREVGNNHNEPNTQWSCEVFAINRANRSLTWYQHQDHKGEAAVAKLRNSLASGR